MSLKVVPLFCRKRGNDPQLKNLTFPIEAFLASPVLDRKKQELYPGIRISGMSRE